MDSGTLWTSESEIRNRIRKERRVDAFLIKSMCEAAKLLVNKGLPIDIIHALLIRSLFILFLEDKGASREAGLYETIKPKAKNYFDLLEDKESTYGLFRKLQEQFNGNITNLVEGEENRVMQEHLEVVRDCFLDGDFNHQPRLFERDQLFNFKIIHIGLISEIYENFLGELKHERSQFYTPFSLADTMLSEVLPTMKGGSRHPLLDLSCGSGFFLVEGYKRLIWKVAAWGNYYGFQLIKKVSKRTLGQYFEENDWIYGRGLNADSKRQDFTPSPIVGTRHIDRYRTDLSVAKTNTNIKYRSVQDGLFDPPLVVFKQGQHSGEIACSLFYFQEEKQEYIRRDLSASLLCQHQNEDRWVRSLISKHVLSRLLDAERC